MDDNCENNDGMRLYCNVEADQWHVVMFDLDTNLVSGGCSFESKDEFLLEYPSLKSLLNIVTL